MYIKGRRLSSNHIQKLVEAARNRPQASCYYCKKEVVTNRLNYHLSRCVVSPFFKKIEEVKVSCIFCKCPLEQEQDLLGTRNTARKERRRLVHFFLELYSLNRQSAAKLLTSYRVWRRFNDHSHKGSRVHVNSK